jgi:uroporphyrinogen-III synthase
MNGTLAAKPTLVWTRSLADWGEDQEYFKDALPRFRVIHLPCISFVGISRERQFAQLEQVLSKGAPLVMVFTSAWGVRYAWENRYLRSHLTGAAIYALGEGTSRALGHYGLSCRHPKVPRGALELGKLILKSTRGDEVVVLPGGVERAFDLRLFLADHGLTALNLDLYQTQGGVDTSTKALADAPAQVGALLHSTQQGDSCPVVLSFASPSAVMGFHRVFGEQLRQCLNTGLADQRLITLALGETTAQRCRQYFGRVLLAPKPTLAALVEQAGVLLQQ